jgi:hypothetical protein
MLSAILHGKAGRLANVSNARDSWRSVFQTREDLLTATVFERLAYLDDSLFWNLLQLSIWPVLERQPSAGVELKELTFWPRLSINDEGSSVEPDIFMRFTLGEDASHIAFIVEIKIEGGHTAKQWANEWLWYQKNHSTDRDDEVYLLAVGGLEQTNRSIEEKKAKEMLKDGRYEPDLRVRFLDWEKLLKALIGVRKQRHEDRRSLRILRDVQAALSLYGIRDDQWLRDLASAGKHYLGVSDSSFHTLAWPSQGLEPFYTWLNSTERYRPIQMGSFPKMRTKGDKNVR